MSEEQRKARLTLIREGFCFDSDRDSAAARDLIAEIDRQEMELLEARETIKRMAVALLLVNKHDPHLCMAALCKAHYQLPGSRRT